MTIKSHPSFIQLLIEKASTKPLISINIFQFQIFKLQSSLSEYKLFHTKGCFLSNAKTERNQLFFILFRLGKRV